MYRFRVLEGGQAANHWPLYNTYMMGSDGTGLRADIRFESGLILCNKREAGSAALALQHRVGELGGLTLQTCLLPEREEPYLLSLELARHRLMILYAKLEEWQMFDLDPDHVVMRCSRSSREKFIEALCSVHDDMVLADGLAQECLIIAVDGSEELSLAHSRLLINRRRSTGAVPGAPIGCGVWFGHTHQRYRDRLVDNFDFLQLSLPWKHLAPAEGDYTWDKADDWARWAVGAAVPITAGPLIRFNPMHLPAWLYIWEHDYETIRDLVYEHVERVVERYKHVVSRWNVVSGLHVNSHLSFNFEQLMDLTRMAVMLVKKVDPDSQVLVEIREPFGEYYSLNQQSIPPMMYADLVTQASISIDQFAIPVLIGQPVLGQFTRDLMQMSNLLDQYSVFGKPIHLTLSAPSSPVTPRMIAAPKSAESVDPSSGHWRQPWSSLIQGHWLEAMCQIAMSKPYIESLAWQDLIDHSDIELPLAGLIDEQIEPKDSFDRLLGFRRHLTDNGEIELAGSVLPSF